MNPLPAVAALMIAAGVASITAGVVLAQRSEAAPPRLAEAAPPSPSDPIVTPTDTPTPTPASTPTPTPSPRSTAGLQSSVNQLLASAGAEGAVSLTELDGSAPINWSLDGDQQFVAASTYKLPLLMEEAQNIAAGKASPNDQLCYAAGDWEDGYYSDYIPGACYTRAELDRRAGIDSDNTAAHMLVRYDGGTTALNTYAKAHGAVESAFYDPNETTSNDLARLWQNEASGGAGGAGAQAYLYPLLTNTMFEQGIPAGVPSGTTVVHKIGILNGEVNDAALVKSGPHGPYVLSVMTDGGSWSLIAQVSAAVSRFEAS